MTGRPTLGQILLGTEGLALLRSAFAHDSAGQTARIDEMRSLIRALESDPGLVSPLEGPEYDLTEGYALWSETYDRPLRLFPVEEPIMHERIDTLSPGTALDAACGTGRYSAYLTDRDHTVIGVDRSPAMLEKARAKLPQSDFREGDLEALPVEDASVDAAVCALALVHLEEIEPAMQELARVLRPGGRLILSDVHPFLILLGWQAQFRTASGDAAFMRIHPHLLSEYTRAGERAGLRMRHCFEPLLTVEAARTPAAERLPEANRAAWVGLPAVVILELEKSP